MSQPVDSTYPRDLVGYADRVPHARWPGGARIAVQFVLNYEEGGENCILHGDAASETFLSEIIGARAYEGVRHPSMESIYEYGSRAGFWRIYRLFYERGIPLTVFGVAMALERNPRAVDAMLDAGFEICSHGWRWIDHQFMDKDTEREHMHKAVAIIERLTGEKPKGWYTGRNSPHTRDLLVEMGGFSYDADDYSDDLPFWVQVQGKDHLVVPYTLDTNDRRFASPQGFNSGEQFYQYLKDAFDVLYAEGAETPKMLSIGLHCRLIGRPGRFMALQRFVNYVQSHAHVWLCRRIDIAEHWRREFPAGLPLDRPKADQVVPSRLPLAAVNALSQPEFVGLLGGVYEHSPWMAERCWQRLPVDGIHGLLGVMRTTLAAATQDEQLALIRAHPDLAGRAALCGELTAESNREQASAGLDQCSAEELARFHALNNAYKAKFGFPFIMAVKGASRIQILRGFERRIHNTPETEFTTALAHINRIASFRILDLIDG